MGDLIRLEKLKRDIDPHFLKNQAERNKPQKATSDENQPILLDQDEKPMSYSKLNHDISKEFIYDQ
jgi:hypothetical protein